VSNEGEHKTLAFLALGGVFVAMSLVWSVFVAWVASSVTRRLGGKPAVKKWLDRLVGSAFVGLGLRLATATQR
jgi:threonine/homoserine/homoserine lactone efflux protein